MPQTQVPQPFKLDLTFPDPVRRALFNLVATPLEHTFGLATLNRLYAQACQTSDSRPFLERALDVLHVSYLVAPQDLARLPRTGPVVVVANHPFGGLDGLVLIDLLRKIRPDVKVMANYILGRIPDLRDFCFLVDPFGGKSAARHNVRAVKASLEWLGQGGLLAVFPSGEVSHIDIQKRAVVDPAWSPTVARIVRKAECPVVPVFFRGGNSALFQLLGLVHPLLRTALLPREFLNKRHTELAVQIGNPIPFKKLAKFTDDGDLTAYLRLRTYILQARRAEGSGSRRMRRDVPAQEPIAAARDAGLLEREVAGLPTECKLLEHNELCVYAARAAQVPHLLHEIGRLREITFRGVSEGTGRSIDLDRFDEHYVHLFVWNGEKKELVGAYRLGPSDEILAAHGSEGFYTSTLFRYERKVLEQMGPALELGRSFVRPEYQKEYAPLLLLWRGIGAYIAAHPKYHVLFGPVSINNKYQSISRELIVSFLEANNALPAMARCVKAKHPPGVRPNGSVDLKACSTVVRDIEEVSDLIAEIESDQKGIPILLKQYLKLGAKILGFNIDPDFGDVLDGLMVVDLKQADERIIERFAGAEAAERVLKVWRGDSGGLT